MSKHSRWPSLYSQCVRKKRLTLNVANEIINKASRKGKQLYKYKCPYCNSFHLTKVPQKEEKTIGEIENISKQFLDINQFLQWYQDEFGQRVAFRFYNTTRDGDHWHCITATHFGEIKGEGSSKKHAKKDCVENLIHTINLKQKAKGE